LSDPDALRVETQVFETIIDGYFPLRESLRQMLVRHGFATACVRLTHAPIMDIPDLASDAPVPLRLLRGTAGIADRLELMISLRGDTPHVSGFGTWQWYDADKAAAAKALSPLTRLAEPAIVQGIGIRAGPAQTRTFGAVAPLETSDYAIVRKQVFAAMDHSALQIWAAAGDQDIILSSPQALPDAPEYLITKTTT